MSFDQYRTPKPGKQGLCSVCGEKKVEGRVQVTLQARTVDPERTSRDANRVRYPAVDSHSRGYCETHAVEVYEAALAALRDPS